MFTFPARGLGQPAYLSEVYGASRRCRASIGVRVTRLLVAGAQRPSPTSSPADVDEWLRLRAARPDRHRASGSAS